MAMRKLLPAKKSLKKRFERKLMTVCIAALCSENDLYPCIVLCRDWRGEVPNVGISDEVYKLKRLSYRWVALIAGSTSRADELCLRLEYSFRSIPFDEQNVANQIRKVYGDYKRDLADSYLKSKYGFSFETLVDKGVAAFGEKFVNDCFSDISQLSVGVELIVAGFVETFDYDDQETGIYPILCTLSEVSENDPVSLEDEFCAVGSGANSARAVLCARGLNAANPLMQTVYTVYEAKTMSENVPGVGRTYSIDILESDGTLRTISDTGAHRLEELFSRFGPRPIPEKPKRINWFESSDSYFERWDDVRAAGPRMLEDQR